MLRRAALVIVLTIGVLGLPASGARSSTLTPEEARFVALHNRARTRAGLRPLAVDARLVAIARRHSQTMAAEGSGRVWHNRGLPYQVGRVAELGENVGAGPSVDYLEKTFMESPEHRAEIFHRSYRQIGVGVVVRDGTVYVTEVFVRPLTRRGAEPRRAPARAGAPPAPALSPSPSPQVRPPAAPLDDAAGLRRALVTLLGLWLAAEAGDRLDAAR